MKRDIVLAGVGGQGVLSLAAILAGSALRDGLRVKQSEVHGMAQRGGAVTAHLRLADGPVRSPLVTPGEADILLSMEPVEAVRYLDWLSEAGIVVSAIDPILNVRDYPPLEDVLSVLRSRPRTVLVDAVRLARSAGAVKAANTVLVGAASALLPLRPQTIEGFLREIFAAKGDAIIEANVRAFQAGREIQEWASVH